mgnify:CR=1 FL=1
MISASLLVPCLLAVLFIAVFGWNWLRDPIEHKVLEKTGRVLQIGGEITVSYAWLRPVLHAGAVTFANPPWALERHMLSAQAVDAKYPLRIKKLPDKPLDFNGFSLLPYG